MYHHMTTYQPFSLSLKTWSNADSLCFPNEFEFIIVFLLDWLPYPD